MLVLATYRPGYRPPWIDKSYAGQVPLQPLSRADSLDLVRSVPGRLDEPITEAIVAKADGNPLFLEQLAFDAGEADEARSAGTVPDTINDVVMARIDRLPKETKRILQVASVIGRRFSLRLLRAVWQGAGPIEPHLSELVRLEFIQERFDSERTTYVFRHALTQETAYSSLLERYRRALHTAAGNAIEGFFEGRVEEVADRLAFHFGRSDDAEKAVDYAILAAEKAQRRWANSEAVAYFEGALRRLEALPETEANRLRRIDAVLKQGDLRYGLAQYPEHREALERIRGMVEESGDSEQRAAWHYWMGLLHSVTGSRPDIAIEHCRKAARIASAHSFGDIGAFAEACLAQAYIVAGQPRNAVAAGERALASFEGRENPWWAARTLWFLSIAANCLGEWQASIAYCHRGLEHGATLTDPRFRSVQPVGWWRLGSTYIQQGNVERGLECCEKALADPAILPRDAAMAKAVNGYGQIKTGRFETGLSELTEALEWLGRSGLRYAYLTDALLLAEGYLRSGRTDSARSVMEETLEGAKASGYIHLEGRACWLMGDSLVAEDWAAAKYYIEAAIEIFERANAQNDFAKAMITRAALHQRAGDAVAARELLQHSATLFGKLGTLDEPARVAAALAALDNGAPIPLLGALMSGNRN